MICLQLVNIMVQQDLDIILPYVKMMENGLIIMIQVVMKLMQVEHNLTLLMYCFIEGKLIKLYYYYKLIKIFLNIIMIAK